VYHPGDLTDWQCGASGLIFTPGAGDQIWIFASCKVLALGLYNRPAVRVLRPSVLSLRWIRALDQADVSQTDLD